MSEEDAPPPAPPPTEGEAPPAPAKPPVRWKSHPPVPGCPLKTCQDHPPPRDSLYQSMWMIYRDGARGVKPLKAALHIHHSLAHKAVEHGWPEKNWPSLRSRAELWDARRTAARSEEIAREDARVAERQGRDEATQWKLFKPKAAKLAAEGNEILTTVASRLRDAVKAATFVRYRRVRSKDPATGQFHSVDQPYVDGMLVANAARVWAAALKDTTATMALLTGGPTARTEISFPQLTTEQLAELEAGRLPEGVTIEMVAQAVLAASDDKAGGESG